MTKLVGAAALALLTLFMLVGFLNSDATLSAPATLAALALTVGLPAAGAALLLRSRSRERNRLSGERLGRASAGRR